MNLRNGALLQGGRYRVDAVIGQGGFGITYKGVQLALNRTVAIKEFFMKDLCERDQESSHVSVPSTGSRELVSRFRQKFLKEARNIASCNCNGIVSVFDVFEENGTAYYVMEYLGGGSLSDKLKRGALPESVALRYTRQVAESLSYIHDRSMMHLDVKPANILISNDGRAVLIDFGLSKKYDEIGRQTSTTPVGISQGYAPMEQYKRGGVSSFTPATDIYSLGATLYKMLTGSTPPEASDLLNDGLPELPVEISQATRNAVVAAMQPQVSMRPQSISDFLAILDYGNNGVSKGAVVAVVNDNSEETIAFDAGSRAASLKEPERRKRNAGNGDVVVAAVAADVPVAPVTPVSAPKNGRLMFVNSIFIVEAIIGILQQLCVLSDGYEMVGIIWDIHIPASIIISIAAIFVVKGTKATVGAVVLLLSNIMRFLMSSLMVIEYDVLSLTIFYTAYIIGLALIISGTGGCRKQVNSVIVISLIEYLICLNPYLLWDFGLWDSYTDVFKNYESLSLLTIYIYLIVICSMRIREKTKLNRQGSSVVWVLIRVFTVLYLASCFMPYFIDVEYSLSWYSSSVCDCSLFGYMNVEEDYAIAFVVPYIFMLVNFVQSFISPRKWINGVSSGLMILMNVLLFPVYTYYSLDFGAILCMVFSVTLFVLTFIPVKKS